MQENRIVIIFLVAMAILPGCEKKIDLGKQKSIDEFNNRLFTKTVINSKTVLDSLKVLSDDILPDTQHSLRTPKATLYINSAAFTKYRVFEKSKGVITAISYFREGKEINTAEYFQNGQVICLFAVDHEGVRNGSYHCYHEDGRVRRGGVFNNGQLVKDTAVDDKD